MEEIFFSNNIKYLRMRLGINQDILAGLLLEIGVFRKPEGIKIIRKEKNCGLVTGELLINCSSESVNG